MKISSNKSFFAYLTKNTHEVLRFRYAFNNFVKNGIQIRYRRSNLGFLWTLLNPLFTMGVISFVFAYVFNQDIKEFSIFLFSGLAPFNFLSASIIGCTTSIVNSEPYIKKIFVPKVLFPLITVSIEGVNFILSLSALFILALLLGARVYPSILLLPFVLVIMYLFSLGLGIILAVTFVYFRDISHLVQVGFTALFYLTPILYPPDAIPAELSVVFKLNPLSYFVILSRKIILGFSVSFYDWIIPSLLAFMLLLVGFYLLFKTDRDIAFRL